MYEICHLVGCEGAGEKNKECHPATCGAIYERCEICGQALIYHNEELCVPIRREVPVSNP